MTAPQAPTRTVLVALLPAAAVVLTCLLLAPGCTSSGRSGPTVAEGPPPAAVVPAETVATEPQPEPSTAAEDPPPVSIASGVEVDDPDDEELDQIEVGMPGPLEQALAECDSARDAWRRGAFDEALASLDRAYSVLLQMPDNGDPVKAQEKADLRQFISRRVVEVYASRQTAVGELDLAIPLVMNPRRGGGDPQLPGAWSGTSSSMPTARSGRYRPMILDELQKAGIPEQLSWLPLIESGYKVRALSTARALGMWQFIPSTGYRYGLRRDAWVDERMDPEKATRAAIAYLTELHGLFGDWLTAIAAYNCGEQNVLRTINRQKINYLDQFWDLYARLPRETARYVPRFLATLHIVGDPAAYGFDLPEPDQPIPFELTRVERSVRLSDLERSLGLPGGVLEELNPELRHRSTPKAPYDLRVPTARGAQVVAALGALPQWTPPVEDAVGVHRVRRGRPCLPSRGGMAPRPSG